MPNWRNLNPNNGPENCKKAMEVAEKNFRIPMVLEPEWLASPHLDELSGMCYITSKNIKKTRQIATFDDVIEFGIIFCVFYVNILLRLSEINFLAHYSPYL